MAQLDRDRIAAAALALVDEKGLEGFTIRAVARQLDVTPMALYHHVRDKAELAVLVVDAAARSQPLAPETGDWREDLWVVAKWMRDSSLAHPALAQIHRLYRAWTPSMLVLTERWFAVWKQSDLPADDALLAAHASARAIIGLVTEERSFEGVAGPADDTMLEPVPNARALLQQPSSDSGTIFELAVRSTIDGLYDRLSRSVSRSVA